MARLALSIAAASLSCSSICGSRPRVCYHRNECGKKHLNAEGAEVFAKVAEEKPLRYFAKSFAPFALSFLQRSQFSR